MSIMPQKAAGIGVPRESVPVPESVTLFGEFPAVLVTVSVPVSAPAAVGEKFTLNDTLCPGFNVSGRLTPVNVNGPVQSIELTSIVLDVLLLVSVTLCEPLVVPMLSLPNARDVGLTESCGADATPLPLSAIAVGDVGALLATDKLPVTLPEVEGAKLTVIVPEPPAATVIGSDSPLVLKPDPVTFAAVMERVPLPVFETVTDCDPLLPTATLPNAKVPGITQICGEER